MNELFYQYTQDLKRCEFLWIREQGENIEQYKTFVLDLTNPDCENLTKWFNRILDASRTA